MVQIFLSLLELFLFPVPTIDYQSDIKVNYLDASPIYKCQLSLEHLQYEPNRGCHCVPRKLSAIPGIDLRTCSSLPHCVHELHTRQWDHPTADAN